MQLVQRWKPVYTETAGPNPTHMDPTQHTQHIIRTETAVCAHERGSGTRQHDSRHVMSAARTEGAAPNTIRPSTQPFIQYCGSIVNRPTPRGPTRFTQAYEISKSTGFQVDFWISLGFHMDFWISRGFLDFTWISSGFLDFTWIS